MPANKKILPLLSGIAMSCIFGFSFMFTAGALKEVSPIELLAFRFGVAALCLTGVIFLFRIKLNYKSKKMSTLLWLSLFQPVFYFICEANGVKLTSSSEAGMIIGSIPVVVAALAALFLKEKSTLAQWVFILFSVLGEFFIVLMGNSQGSSSHLSGIIYLLGAVMSAGIFNILSRKISTEFNPVEITFFMMWTGAVVFNATALATRNGNLSLYLAPLFKPSVLFAVLYLGVLSSIVAFFLFNFMLSKLPASQSAVFNNLTTVVSIFAGVILKGEPFHWYHTVGTIAILAGVWGTNYFGFARHSSNTSTT